MFLVAMIALALFLLPPGWGLAAVMLGLAVEVAEVGFWVRFLRRYRIVTGAEGLVGLTAEVIEACDPRGRVRFRGEIWHAHCDLGAEIGERVEITGVHGLTLQVVRNGKGPR
jgi:membrane protein implicated in regulation of membrane protease activity